MSEAKLTRSQQLFNRARDERKKELEAERNADRDRKILLGAAMIAAMKDDEALRHQVVQIVNKHTTKPNDRRRVAEWLPHQS